MKTNKFQDLIVWQKAHQLVLGIYSTTKSFPKDELFGIVSQIRRSSVSIAANIAEGYKKRGIADKNRFLNISEGSNEETKYYLILARDLDYLPEHRFQQLYTLSDEISKMLGAYSRTILKSISNS